MVKKILTTSIIMGMSACMVLGIKYLTEASSNSGSSDEQRVKGEASAPIKITEFIDFQCPACVKGVQFLRQYMKEHPGKIRLEVKHYPLEMHKHGMLSARYAQCAAQQKKFWPYQDGLADRQNQWKGLIDARPAFELIAKDVKLDMRKLNSCLSQQSVDAMILKDKAEGKARGVTSTPTYFVNEEKVVGSKQLGDRLNQLLGVGPPAAPVDQKESVKEPPQQK